MALIISLFSTLNKLFGANEFHNFKGIDHWFTTHRLQKREKNSPECELASSECQDPEDEMCTLYSESPTV